MPVTKFDADGYALLIILPSGGVECRATFVRKGLEAPFTIETLRSYLASAGVRFGIDDEALSSFCAGVNSGDPLEKVLLARGIAPEPGENGCLAFPEQESSNAETDEETDQVQRVDHRRVKSLISIKSGEVVARIMPPVPGQPGTSVTGESIPPPEVTTVAVTLGNGVAFSDDGQSVIATTAGRVVYQDNQLSISEEFEVKGNVDFKVGHIDFDGIVIVKGDILDDFNVRAGKGLIVGGAIGACAIESGGVIQICGMSGQGRGTIRSTGIIFARYLNEVDIEVDGSVMVEKEILKSKIRATGVVMCDGHLAGGSCVARGGIETKVLGSASGLSTVMIAGADYRDLEALTALYKQLDEVSHKLASTTDKQILEELCVDKRKLQKDIMALKTKQYDNSNAKINVQSRVEDQVVLTLGETTQTLSELTGPVSIIENMAAEGGFSILKLTPLDIKASVLRMEVQTPAPTPERPQ